MKWILACAFFAVAFAINPEEAETDPDVFEGDMILTPEQKMAAVNGWDVDAPLGRGGIKNKRWPGGVFVYQIDGALARSSKAMNAINGAFREWSSKTCITFKKRTNERDYAYFRIGSGCSSWVGRSGGRQTINLASGCWYVGIVAHEIGHALGFYHEQSRPDRDNYVTIMWNNIIEKSKFNFNKYNRGTIDSLGTPYDYGSVMHYGSRAFSKNGRPTIVAKQSGVTLGQRRGLSAIDAKQMNLMYKSECSGGGGGGGSSCVNNHSRCDEWAQRGECKKNPRWMLVNCKKSCKVCS
ncbi:zinc metalloproteinase nas-15 [Exaiptasia diaphana]|uniref:Metalloendopeptidase n=1 Tax=Exaiptasia diaphana TaxID=2652724 RepID=A0A913XAV0_EXADI|nr:zinc metalloproteinase nas-15 [Exaiptasia diaphana]